MSYLPTPYTGSIEQRSTRRSRRAEDDVNIHRIQGMGHVEVQAHISAAAAMSIDQIGVGVAQLIVHTNGALEGLKQHADVQTQMQLDDLKRILGHGYNTVVGNHIQKVGRA